MKLQHSIQVGLSFGLTSGVITTLGLVVGLAAGTASRLAVLGGIVTIAVADSLSDALGIHVAEESESIHTQREIWASTLATFASKLVMALSFAVPVLVFDLATAVIASVAWGVAALAGIELSTGAPPGRARLAGGDRASRRRRRRDRDLALRRPLHQQRLS